MKKIFLSILIMALPLTLVAHNTTMYIPEDLQLQAAPIVGSDPTPEEQTRLKQFFDSVYAIGPVDVYTACYKYNHAVAPNHKGHYWIKYTDSAGEEVTFDCAEPSALEGIPVLSQIWSTIKWFLLLILFLALPFWATYKKWSKGIRILIYVIFAIPVIISAIAFILAALASIWAIICCLAMVIVAGICIFAVIGAASSAFKRQEAEANVDRYARTHNGMYEHGSRVASIDQEMKKLSKKGRK